MKIDPIELAAQITSLNTALEASKMMRHDYETRFTSGFNGLFVMEPDEVHFTKIIANLLNPDESHNQRECFLNIFLKELKFDISKLGRFIFLQPEYDTGDNGRLDIFIKYEHHSFIIENKIWRSDDKGQLDKYINWIRQQNGQYSIIYLTMKGNEPKFSEKWKLSDKKFILLSYKNNVYEWLSKCSLCCKSAKVVAFIEEFKEWIEFTIRGGESIMSESDVLQQLIVNDKDKFEMLWNITNVFDFKKFITEDCVQKSRDSLINQLKSKLPKYSIKMECSSQIFQKEKQGWISIYKDDWTEDNDPIIYYAIETLTWADGVAIGISRKENKFEYPNEDDIIKQLEEMANENQYTISNKKSAWWLGQIYAKTSINSERDADNALYMAWHLANDKYRKCLLDEVVEITEKMVDRTESIISSSIKQLKNT